MNAGRRNWIPPFCNLLAFIITHQVVTSASFHTPRPGFRYAPPASFCRVHLLVGQNLTRLPCALSPKLHVCSMEMLTLLLRPRPMPGEEAFLYQQRGGLSPFRFPGSCRGYSKLPRCVLTTVPELIPQTWTRTSCSEDSLREHGEARWERGVWRSCGPAS